MNVKPIITVSNIRKTYKVLRKQAGFFGGFKTFFSLDYEEVKAVDGVTFDIEPGEIVGYIGPNGAGKSTTIKILTGVLHPTDGKVVVDGLIPYRSRRQNSKNIGVLFGQRSHLVWDLPPNDAFELLRRMYSIPLDNYKANLHRFTELLELEDLLNKPVRQLSLGQRMRCELVATLLHDPKIVYLDEPTIGLDVVSKERIREFIIKLNQEREVTILLTTHDLSDIEKLCKRIIILDKGTVIFDGELSEIKRKYGRLRNLIFFPAEDLNLDRLLDEVKSLEEGITVDFRKDKAILLSFNPNRVSASEITKQIVNNYEVKDLSVEQVDIEAIIREIYEMSKAI